MIAFASAISMPKQLAKRGTRKAASDATERRKPGRERGAIPAWSGYLMLALLTACVYGRVLQYPFTNYDDRGYITENFRIQAGLTWQTVAWSFTSIEQANWHPVTWISHALDWELYGGNAGGHHATSLALHILNVWLLYYLLKKSTRAVGRSFIVAGVFALHPFNVQSVAWVAERKNVLSTLFMLLAIAAYGWYARNPGWTRYSVVFTGCMLGLAAKPMLVTLPGMLLILDYWPLRRIAGWSEPSEAFAVPQVGIRKLLVEKIPFAALSVASSVITVVAQKAHGAVQTAVDFPYPARFENAFSAYAAYLVKTFWPSGFAVYYPNPFDPTLPEHPGWGIVAVSFLSLILVVALSVVAWRQRLVRPYLTAGWLWYVLVLIPVIGIVQVGRQAMADRYTYVPLLGIFVAAVWGFCEVADRRKMSSSLRRGIALACLLALAILSWREVGNWASSYHLWTHALEVTTNNYIAEGGLGNDLVVHGRYDEALSHYQRAATLDAQDADARVNIGTILESRGQHHEAAEEYEEALRILSARPRNSPYSDTIFAANLNLGNTCVELGDYTQARISYKRAMVERPADFLGYVGRLKATLAQQPSAAGYVMLSLALQETGDETQSAQALREAIAIEPSLSAAIGAIRESQRNP